MICLKKNSREGGKLDTGIKVFITIVPLWIVIFVSKQYFKVKVNIKKILITCTYKNSIKLLLTTVSINYKYEKIYGYYVLLSLVENINIFLFFIDYYVIIKFLNMYL